MARVDFWEENHPLGQLALSETFVDEQVVTLVHSAVAALAGSAEHFETSAECGRVVGVEQAIGWEVSVAVVHADRVHLFFITFNTVWGSNVVSEQPGLSVFAASQGVDGATRQQR